MSVFLLTALSCSVLGAPVPQSTGEAIPIVFDTDMASDVDDVGALAVLHALADSGEAEILATVVSSTAPGSPGCLAALNAFFGRPDIPIGVVRDPQTRPKGIGAPSLYAEEIARRHPHALAYEDGLPSGADLYRRVLAAAKDRSVVIVTVGFLTQLADLLDSQPDRASGLSGVDLVRLKVRHWVCMGGAFPSGPEFNIATDAPSSMRAIGNWPTPITFSGFEIGSVILTGAGLAALPERDPVREAYRLFHQGQVKDRQSWDQTAVLYAVRGLDGRLRDVWDLKQGLLRVQGSGVSSWEDLPDGPHAHLVQKMPAEKVARMIEDLMRQRAEQSLP